MSMFKNAPETSHEALGRLLSLQSTLGCQKRRTKAQEASQREIAQSILKIQKTLRVQHYRLSEATFRACWEAYCQAARQSVNASNLDALIEKARKEDLGSWKYR